MEKEIITCEDCGTEHKSKLRQCPECGFDRRQNPDDQRPINDHLVIFYY